MKPFRNLIEFRLGDRIFYNRNIRCPVCDKIMWWDDTKADSSGTKLFLVCRDNCCKMEIEISRCTFWDDKIEEEV